MPACHPAVSRFLARLQMSSALSVPEQQAIRSLDWTEVEYRAHREIARPGDTVAHANLIAGV